MSRRIKIVITAVLMTALVLMLGSCSKKVETGVATGTLKAALDTEIVLNTSEGEQHFVTNEKTVYDLGGMDQLNLNDVVDVEYHTSGKDMTADKVILREHIQRDLTFNGKVTDVNDKAVTVTGKSLTVSFVINAETQINGDLSVGDEVAIVYMGDLSEYPYASVITVSSEAETEPKTSTVSGIVTEFTETSVLISIDSATSYRFEMDTNTSITGVAKYLRIGDSVTITFEGDVASTPKASNVNIVREAQEERRTVNGTIENVTKDYLTLNTGKKVYIIQTDKNTKYTGDKPAKGYKSEITYTGILSSGKAVAVNVYCVKVIPEPNIYLVSFVDGFGNLIKTVQVEEGKAAVAPAPPLLKGYKFVGWDKSFNKVTSDMTVTALWEKETVPVPEPDKPDKKDEPAPEPQPEPEPSEQTVRQEGVITEWTSEANPNSFKVRLDDGTEIGLNIEDDLDIPSGYFPAVGDRVEVTFFEKSMKLVKMDLIEKAQTAPEEEKTAEDEITPEEQPSGELPPTEDTQPAPEPDKPVEAEETQPAPEPEKPSVPEEEVPEPEVDVTATGVIKSGDESKGVFVIEIEGKDVSLNTNSDSQIAAGFFPQTGDTVEVTYSKSDLMIRSVKLISRPVPEPPAPQEQAEENSEG